MFNDMKTSVPFALAAVLAIVTALAHALLGGREILRPVLASSLSREVRHVVEVVWHMLTWHLVLLGAAFAAAAFSPGAAWVAWVTVWGGVTCLGYAALFLGFALARFGDVRRLPQWTLFLPMGVLAMASTFRVSAVPVVGELAAIAAAAVLAALGLLHLVWAIGSPWPLPNRTALAMTVVGDSAQRMPGRGATVAVAGLLVFASIWVLSLRGVLVPQPSAGLLRASVTWGMVFVFALRGVGGFFEAAIRPNIIGTPYLRWSLRLYSPLSAALAAAIGLAAA
jgi:hypothetical protein